MMKEEYFSLSFHDLSIALEPNFLIFWSFSHFSQPVRIKNSPNFDTNKLYICFDILKKEIVYLVLDVKISSLEYSKNSFFFVFHAKWNLLENFKNSSITIYFKMIVSNFQVPTQSTSESRNSIFRGQFGLYLKQ